MASLRHVSVDAWPTRDRILYEASRLIAARGYHGATTRDIADGVGIKQPSMFNHFASKQAILEELLLFDLTIPGERAEQLSFESSPPGVRLYRYASWDLRWYQEMPYDLRGMHEDLLRLPGLEPFRNSLQRWNDAIARILDQGVHAGEFRSDAVPFIPALLDTLSWEFVRSAHKEAVPAGLPYVTEDAVGFVMRGLLIQPKSLATIQDAADFADKVVT